MNVVGARAPVSVLYDMLARSALFLACALLGSLQAHGETIDFVFAPDQPVSGAVDWATPEAERPAPAPTHDLPAALAGCSFSDPLTRAARLHGLDPQLVIAVADAETRCRHVGQRSPKGAIGLMQLMPATARRFGAPHPWDIEQNIAAGTAYLAWLHERYGGDLNLVLAAYNAGEGAVDRHGGVPPFAETRAYVARILGALGGADTRPRAARARIEPAFVIEIAPHGGPHDDAADALYVE